MAKSIIKQFRDFVDALPAQSNQPMTGREIATAAKKKKTTAKRTAKAVGKKANNAGLKKSAKKAKKEVKAVKR